MVGPREWPNFGAARSCCAVIPVDPVFHIFIVQKQTIVVSSVIQHPLKAARLGHCIINDWLHSHTKKKTFFNLLFFHFFMARTKSSTSRKGIAKTSSKKSNTDTQKVKRPNTQGPTKYLHYKHLSFILEIYTDKLPIQHGMLENRFEAEDAKITRIGYTIPSYVKDDDLFPLSKDELRNPGFIGNSVTFSNTRLNEGIEQSTTKTFTNTRGYFTVEEMIKNITEFEVIDRPKSKWFGGIDAHHVFYEGIHKEANGSYRIHWGS